MAESIALTRIRELLDEGSFVEVGAFVSARITDFTLKADQQPSDGVITGYGQIDGNPVFVYSQNRDVLNGTMGEMHAKKIADLYDLAEKTAAPVIALLDCGGFRLQESVDALDAFGRVLAKQTSVSDSVVQICGILGNCSGGLTMIPALSDFAFMTRDAQMFVNAPHTITDDPGLARGFEAGKYQNEISGRAEVLDTEAEVLKKIRELVIMLSEDSYGICDEAGLNRYISGAAIANRDTRALLAECADDVFVELRSAYYPEMVTGLMRLNGMRVGVIGNASALYDEKGEKTTQLPTGLTAGGCKKAAEFLEFCDTQQIPVLTVTAADGFDKSAATEEGLPAALAALIKEFSLSDWNTKINLIIGDTYGSAYLAMNAKAIGGAALTLAWEDVKVGMMEAEKAANILFAKDPEQAKKAAAYEKRQNSVQSAAARGSVDLIIDPKQTRKHLIMAFSML